MPDEGKPITAEDMTTVGPVNLNIDRSLQGRILEALSEIVKPMRAESEIRQAIRN